MKGAWLLLALAAVGCKKPEPAPAPEAPEVGSSVTPAPPPPSVRRARPVAIPVDRDDDPRIADMVPVPAGPFLHGCDLPIAGCEKDLGTFDMPGFYIDTTEVTVAAYRECVSDHACEPPRITKFCPETQSNSNRTGYEQHPVNCVDADLAWKYCLYRGKRLPTEYEWEKAARGTDGRPYPWGAASPTCRSAVLKLPDGGCRHTGTAAVGTTPNDRSPYGVMDLAGNVREYVANKPPPPYFEEPMTIGELRGGSYSRMITGPGASLFLAGGTGGDPDVGFRCAVGMAGARY